MTLLTLRQTHAVLISAASVFAANAQTAATEPVPGLTPQMTAAAAADTTDAAPALAPMQGKTVTLSRKQRSEERRVGKECRL